MLIAILLVTACENEKIMVSKSLMLVGFSASNVIILENQTGDISLFLGAVAGESVTVTLEVSTEDISSPAVEGSDYTISTKQPVLSTGETEVMITPIDNDEFTGDKSFYVTIVTGENFQLAAENTVLVTIQDDEHPLKNWIGTYDVDAQSYGDPDNWDEAWVVITAPVPGDITKLSMLGIGGGDDPIIADIDTDNMTVTIAPGQDCGNAYGYDIMYIYYGFENLTLDKEAPLTGTISADGTISVDNWGHNGIYDGDDYGVWDVFNTTWTKR